MFQIIGIVLLFALVFGSYIISGGNMAPIIHAAPHELMAIGGAAIAAFLISNSTTTLKATGGGFGKVFKGPKWKASDYTDLLSLLFLLTKTMKSKGVIALESHIENPHESTIFSRYPKIAKDHFAVDFICDTLRMMTMNLEDPHQVEDAMEKQLEKHHHEGLAAAHALSNVADGLPALGIVAAVLGVIKTMGSITEPLAVLVTIAVAMTAGVYGLVAGIVKLDDLGLYLSRRARSGARAIGNGILRAAPWMMKGLSVAGTAAMFLVGGSILEHGLPPLHEAVEEASARSGAWHGVVAMLLNALTGIVAGSVLVGAFVLVRKLRGKPALPA